MGDHQEKSQEEMVKEAVREAKKAASDQTEKEDSKAVKDAEEETIEDVGEEDTQDNGEDAEADTDSTADGGEEGQKSGKKFFGKKNKKDKKDEKIEELTDRLMRTMAEFDNYKKRSAKERDGLYNSLVANIVTSLLPILDNLEKAVSSKTEDESYKQGVEMVLKQFSDSLSSLGVETIKTVGESFNPEYHEAVSSVEDETLGEKIIKEEFRKGYKIGEKVIRHSMVVVAN